MKQAQAVAVALLALVCTGCSATTSAGSGRATATESVRAPVASAAPAQPACASAGPLAPVSSVRGSGPAPWPQRLVVRQSPAELISGQVIDPTTGVVYALISRTHTPMRGPYVLECTELRTGSVRNGPVFLVGSLTTVSGYLWVYGEPRPDAQPVISQASPATLARIRSVPLPQVPAGFGGAVFTTGPGSSVWIGSYRTLLRVDVSTGAVVTRVMLPPGLAVSDISVDPAHTTLYVSAARIVRYGVEGLVMLEYGAWSGHRLAEASSGVLRYSAAGAGLTAVPGGVWASFRTGMQGLTIHLARAGLRMIAPPGPGIARTRPSGVFHWVMYEATAYGGGALWLANQAGIVACLDPRTGKARASERRGQSTNQLIYQLQAIDPATRAIYALNLRGLLRITPPRRCWG